MTDRVLDKDRLRLVTPEMLNDYFWRRGHVTCREGSAEGTFWCRSYHSVFVPLDASRGDYVYLVSSALHALSIAEGRPEADILRDLLAGQEQEAEVDPLAGLESYAWRIVLSEWEDGAGKRHFSPKKGNTTFCGLYTRCLEHVYTTDHRLQYWGEDHRLECQCPDCFRKIRDVAAEALRRLGYPPEALRLLCHTPEADPT